MFSYVSIHKSVRQSSDTGAARALLRKKCYVFSHKTARHWSDTGSARALLCKKCYVFHTKLPYNHCEEAGLEEGVVPRLVGWPDRAGRVSSKRLASRRPASRRALSPALSYGLTGPGGLARTSAQHRYLLLQQGFQWSRLAGLGCKTTASGKTRLLNIGVAASQAHHRGADTATCTVLPRSHAASAVATRRSSVDQSLEQTTMTLSLSHTL